MAAAPHPTLGPGNRRNIARRLGLKHQHINLVIEGKESVSLDRAHDIAMVAGVSLDELWYYRHTAREERAAELRKVVEEGKRVRTARTQRQRSQTT